MKNWNWIDNVVRDLCELPDRGSPDDHPEMMLVTPDELLMAIEKNATSTDGSLTVEDAICAVLDLFPSADRQALHVLGQLLSKPLPAISSQMNFGQAIEMLKSGAMVQRDGWNGKGMHIYLEDGRHLPLKAGVEKGTTRIYDSVICMFTAQKTHQPGWLASQADMLADDWQVVGGLRNNAEGGRMLERTLRG